MGEFIKVENGKEGFGFAQARAERTSYAAREFAREFTGTATGLYAIHNAVYMALMGPKGLEEVGETNILNSQYAKNMISKIDGVNIRFSSQHFNEFIVDFNDSKKIVSEINRELKQYKIFGGKDLSKEFPELGEVATYCVTEIHSKEEIDNLIIALKEVLK